MKPAIGIENLSKQYRLGLVGTGTLSHDLKRWWHLLRGKEDPYLKIGETNDRAIKGSSQYVWALKDINLEVMPGEVLGIIGKNGAGKSTLLKILSKVTGPTTGKIDYKGRIGSLLEVGTGFHPELTGRENIYLNGAILGMRKKEIDRKFDEIVDFSGVERYIDTPTKRYSSGMTVRLGFAVAAFLEPEILVVDEVLAVGDAEFQKKAIGKMQDVSKNEGRTVLFVSHNMASIQRLCNNGIILNRGTVSIKTNISDCVKDYMSSSYYYDSNVDLIDRIDRKGNAKVKFAKIELMDSDGNVLNEAISGMELLIKIHLIKTDLISNLIFRVIFIDINGIIRFVCSNYHSDAIFPSLKGNKITLQISDFPLPKGEYAVHLLCMENKEISDEIENAYKFSVIEGDFYKTGKNPAITDGVLVKHSWGNG
jgi:lipopolysaccharide transport system ATP-binding protein